MNKDTHVYCTNCVNFIIDCDIDRYCNNSCPCYECDCFDFEDSRPLEERPKYMEK